MLVAVVACMGFGHEVAAQDRAVSRDSCLTVEQRQELFRRTNAVIATNFMAASIELSARASESSAAHSRAQAAFRRCESEHGAVAGEKCGDERSATERAARAHEEIAILRRQRMNEAKAAIPETIRSIRAEYPDCGEEQSGRIGDLPATGEGNHE